MSFRGPLLPGKFINAKKTEDSHLLIYYNDGIKVPAEDNTVRFEAWHKSAIELENELIKIQFEDDKELKNSDRDIDYIRRASERLA